MSAKARANANLATYFENNLLVLVCILPLLVPFGLSRNIDLQAMVVVLSGALAWTAVLLRQRQQKMRLNLMLLCIGLYCLACTVSWLVHASVLNAFGGALARLGSLELLSAVGIGLALAHLPRQRLVTALYASIIVLALISLPYNLLTAHHLVRIGGLLHQPDFFAVIVGVGLLLGADVWQKAPKYRPYLAAGQAYLVIVLVMTQTRAVIALLLLLTLSGLWLSGLTIKRKTLLSLVSLALIAMGFFSLQAVLPGRLTNGHYADQSVSYRLSLQGYAVKALPKKPPAGYGAGSLPQALPCRRLTTPALQATCHEGHYFDSSHNVYLDRLLALGWLGGLSFIGLVILALFKGSHQRNVFWYITLLIALYYLTNPTDLEIELLMWVALCRAAPILQ